MKTRLIIPLGLLLMVATASRGEEVEAETSELDGTWSMISLVENGDSLDPEHARGMRQVIRGRRFEFTDEKKPSNDRTGTLRLDPSRSPKQIDMSDPGSEVYGIYELDGDTLTICLGPSGVPLRPVRFVSSAGTGCTVAVFKREK